MASSVLKMDGPIEAWVAGIINHKIEMSSVLKMDGPIEAPHSIALGEVG
tara:strand:- start:9155 stop:9301 length:147 start_codon:yes stop_codon:yes gene_type:complete